MAKILEKYINLLPRLQARKIEDELRKNPSLTRDAAAFRAAYQAELRALLDSDEVLRTQMIEMLSDSTRDSEVVNWGIRSIASDLSALSAEADALSSLKDMELNVMRSDVLDKLRRATMEAEAEVERMELIRGNVSGLRDALVDNFSSSANRLSRSDEDAEFTFLDPKTGEAIDPLFDCTVGNYGLTLPVDISRSLQPSSIKEVIFSDVRSSEDRLVVLGADYPSTNGVSTISGRIENLIDGRVGTFWSKKLTTEEKPEVGALVNLELNMGPGVSQINFIEVQPAIENGQEIIGVYYLDENMYQVEVALDGSIKLDQPRRIMFDSARARKICLVVRQSEYLTLANPADGTQRRVYRFGLDNISVGDAKYLKKGYYISKTISSPMATKAVLDASWSVFSPEDAERFQSNPTVEFWVSIRELDAVGVVVYDKVVPILPVGTSLVYESLEVSNTNKARLAFSVEEDVEDGPLFKVYRDSVQILNPNDYTISIEDNTIEEGAILNMPQGFNRASEFVAEYVPLLKQTGAAPNVFLDETGVVQFNSDGSINIIRPESSRAVRSELNLIIVLRGTGNFKSSPIVNKYTFSVG